VGFKHPPLTPGRVLELVELLCQGTLVGILEGGSGEPITKENLAILAKDFATGKSQTVLLLKTKLDFWQRLPWLLCGLAHHEDAVAQRVARDALQAMRDAPDPAVHHRTTVKFLPGGRLHEDLIAVSTGRDIASLSEEFQKAVAILGFIPVTETTIEAKHAKVTKSGKRASHQGPVLVSLSNRMALIQRRLARVGSSSTPGKKDLWFSECFLECFGIAKHLAAVPGHLGIHQHPILASVLSRSPSRISSCIARPLARVIYRLDFEEQFVNLKGIKRAHDHDQNQDSSPASRLQPTTICQPFESTNEQLLLASTWFFIHQFRLHVESFCLWWAILHRRRSPCRGSWQLSEHDIGLAFNGELQIYAFDLSLHVPPPSVHI
jgi:hypothetical protein